MYRWAAVKCIVIAGVAAWFGVSWLLWLALALALLLTLGSALEPRH